jgi:DNA modification methylase
LIEPCILAGSRVGDVLFDPFAGSGTTGVVAVTHGRKAIMCELNAEYVELIKARMAQAEEL